MTSNDIQFEDMQGLLRFGYGKLTESCFLLLNVVDQASAKNWLAHAPVTNADELSSPPQSVLQIAFSACGLQALGLDQQAIEGFSDEFISGMSGNESRSRRLGDVEGNAPKEWKWGSDPKNVPHILLLMYATKGGLAAWRHKVEANGFSSAFHIDRELPTSYIGNIEPFGFVDGVSQPKLDWRMQQTTDRHKRDAYSNALAVGEVVLGYPNEYRQYTARPLLDPNKDSRASVLPDAGDQPHLKDFARNGSYLVLRQLDQDVPKFWQFLNTAVSSDPEKREQLASAMVGRQRDGTPLMPLSENGIAGISAEDKLNHFLYASDPAGNVCPVGAHIRRANPRTGDMPVSEKCLFSRFLRILGFGNKRPDDDLIASARYHRLLRRGRTYGPLLKPEDAVKKDAPKAPRGLQFICLVANISRQFEFVQNAWMVNSKFAGLQSEQDPLLGVRQPLSDGSPTDRFHRPDARGPARTIQDMKQFITVLGGAYFFMPGLKALSYLASLPNKPGGESS